ncbi:MAG: hypothetical protein NC904_08090 [Candidatus Omnitrophica bacterium]|nr:hypothetical protein [Candidatus Omnitrophota bacterium]
MGKKSFTLVEIITVLVIVGISIGLFYSVFYVNLVSLDKETTSLNLWEESKEIVEKISFDGKICGRIELISEKEIAFIFLDHSEVRYIFSEDGQLIRKTLGDMGENVIISSNINYDGSKFDLDNDRVLILELTLEEDVLGKPVTVSTSTQIMLRNYL